MPAKTNAPLKSLMPFGKSILHTVDSKYNYAVCGLNVGNTNTSYDFTEGEFKLTILTGGGMIEGDIPWLLATIPADEAGKLFSYEIRSNSGGSWAVDKPASEKILSDWKSSNCLIAVNVSNIPVLKALVTVLHEMKLFISNTIRVNLAVTDDKCAEIQEKLKTYFTFVKENQKPLPPKDDVENYTAIGILNKFMGVPQVSFLGLPQTDELDEEYGLPTGNKVNVSVPFEGDYPFEIEKLIFTAPDLETTNGKKKSWGGGTSVNVEGYSSENAWKFIKENYEDMEVFFKSKMPGIAQSQITSIALSLAGVQVLPRLFPNVADTYQPLIPIIDVPSTNGSNTSEKTIEQQLEEMKEETLDTTPVTEGMIKEWFKKNKLKPETWLKNHKTQEEYELFLSIVTSEFYTRKPTEVHDWVGTKLGMGETPVPVTALNSLENLKELAQLCKDADTRLKIDQDATLV